MEKETIVSNRLAELRISAGMTQEKLAQEAKIESMIISRLERGESKLTNTRLGTCLKIAGVLGVKVEELI
ncbi:MAG: helix-turn-helix transcriptional regulator [Oscillospiraceae bacterium]